MHSLRIRGGYKAAVLAALGTALLFLIPYVSYGQGTTTPTTPGLPSTGAGGDPSSTLTVLGLGVFAILLGVVLLALYRQRHQAGK